MNGLSRASAVYLCYFGLREPLVQTQVLPYLRELTGTGYFLHLLTFEPESPHGWPGSEAEAWRQRLREWGIAWSWKRYHRRPSLPATAYDVLVGAAWAARQVRSGGARILHARGHWAGAMAALARPREGVDFLLDIRGFTPEEYVDAGLWPSGSLVYRLAKAAESWMVRRADGFVVLTERARSILFPGCEQADGRGRPISVIPCCVDLRRFEAATPEARAAVRSELGVGEGCVYVYTGALGGWYLTDELAEFLAQALHRSATAFASVLTQSDPARLVALLHERGIPRERFLVRSVPPTEVPRYLAAGDVAVSLIKPSYSKQASSPTKLAEYLAAGLPVVSNRGIGDVDQLLTSGRVGVLLDALDPESYRRALDQVDALRSEPGAGARCRTVAAEQFDLRRVGGPRYRALYEALTARKDEGVRR